MSDSEKLEKAEEEVKKLRDELKIHKEAKPFSKVCEDIAKFSQKENEPFSTAPQEHPNPWMKSEGGGCVIL
eukprot:CAMPEP_0197745290 /NCGR_PEP_ID=MMETSP1435-20131217/41627_1 /TAXON_ID=426625 /ORGANISM="Chaetoceros brevis, Strain CCMP164" /LENGTH=70 /DNA_ID=CAMNT_0043336973 /DNA_START=28 /DNA_END=240 /DNA_ORIENTATION=-